MSIPPDLKVADAKSAPSCSSPPTAQGRLPYCDMVMKGGITSGVVYPLAITRLAEKFVFKNIGGTSAGAIAAAAAAAAELTRTKGGFERLAQLPGFLGGKVTRVEGTDRANDKSSVNTNLAALFQPQTACAKVFRLGTAALGEGRGPQQAWKISIALLKLYPLAWILGLLPAMGFAMIAYPHLRGDSLFIATSLIVCILLALVGMVVALGIAVMRDVTSALPGNFYGLCSGMTEEFADIKLKPATGDRGKPLTFWLTEYLNGFVDRQPYDAPLTFGELWGREPKSVVPGGENGARTNVTEGSDEGEEPEEEKKINLEMMTTCLTHGRPYRLPFRSDDGLRENSFYFKTDEFSLLFPKSVVEWMITHPRPLTGESARKRQDSKDRRANLAKLGYYPLCAAADLPVVVATRMSLSFPVLLSAVPLYLVRHGVGENVAPERCWFTDGGVCSNFPIHFFDSPLPRWPTLSLNLVSKPKGTPKDVLLKVEMVTGNGEGIRESVNRFEYDEELRPGENEPVAVEKSGLRKLTGFVGAFISTMQNWTDNTQSRLPGFRDRIAHLGLTPEEGGLNLTMPTPLITELTKRGQKAADLFIERFAPPSASKIPNLEMPEEGLMAWDNHRWTRLRTFLASMETFLQQVEKGCSSPEGGDVAYDVWLKDFTLPVPSYQWKSKAQRQAAAEALDALRKATAALETAALATDGHNLNVGAPRPRFELRPRPQI